LKLKNAKKKQLAVNEEFLGVFSRVKKKVILFFKIRKAIKEALICGEKSKIKERFNLFEDWRKLQVKLNEFCYFANK